MEFFSVDLLMNIFGIIVAIIVLSILVAVHELGHLLMAKWSNIRVDVFSVGMGKPIWGKQYGETFYQIGRLPFGGFCAFGEEENGDKEDSDPRALPNSPLWARLLTVIGGSLFNLIFAYLVLVLLFSIGFKEKQLSNVVSVPEYITYQNIQEKNISPAYQAGMRSGDIIIAIDDQIVSHFMQIPLSLAVSTRPEKRITYLRENTTNSVMVPPIADNETGMEYIGVQPVRPSIVSSVLEGSRAEKAGIRPNDQIVSINGVEIEFFYQLAEKIQEGQPLTLEIKRDQENLSINITPEQTQEGWIIGIVADYPHQIEVIQKVSNIGEAFILAKNNLTSTISQIGSSLVKLFGGKVDVQQNLSGPVRIVSIIGDVAQTQDIALLVKFMVMLSVALAVFNLLPFPGLDGGAIITQTARSIFKKNKTAEKIIGIVEQFGMLLLLSLAVFVLFNDIRNIAKDSTADTKTEQIP